MTVFYILLPLFVVAVFALVLYIPGAIDGDQAAQKKMAMALVVAVALLALLDAFAS